MIRKKDTPLSLNDPEVIEERNNRIAERMGKKLGYSQEKTRGLCSMINILAIDPAPQKLLEYLYEKQWAAKPGISRADIQRLITECHEEAFGWLQNTYQNLRDG